MKETQDGPVGGLAAVGSSTYKVKMPGWRAAALPSSLVPKRALDTLQPPLPSFRFAHASHRLNPARTQRLHSLLTTFSVTYLGRRMVRGTGW